MTKKERALIILEKLEEVYPDVKCSLNFSNPLEMLIATQLSAQCTDARVNIITETLFKKYPDLDSFADADLYRKLEQYRQGLANYCIEKIGKQLFDELTKK